MPRAAWITAVLLGVAVSGRCEAQAVKVSRSEFPGFSIELPAGTVIEDSKEPAGGQHLRFIAESGLAGIPHLSEPKVEVLWLTQSMTFDYFQNQFLESMAAHQPNAVPGERVLRVIRLDASRWLAIYGTPQMPIGLGHVNCGPGFSVGIKLRLHATIDPQIATVRSMLESVRCALGDKLPSRPRAPVHFDAGLGRIDGAPVQLYRSLSGEYIMVSFTQGELFGDAREWHHAALAAAELVMKRAVPEKWTRRLDIEERADLRASRLVRIDLPDDARPVYIGGVQCEGVKLSFMVAIQLPQADDKLAERRLSQVGCPGDKAADMPLLEDVADAACRAGDIRGCPVSR